MSKTCIINPQNDYFSQQNSPPTSLQTLTNSNLLGCIPRICFACIFIKLRKVGYEFNVNNKYERRCDLLHEMFVYALNYIFLWRNVICLHWKIQGKNDSRQTIHPWGKLPMPGWRLYFSLPPCTICVNLKIFQAVVTTHILLIQKGHPCTIAIAFISSVSFYQYHLPF